MRPLLELLTTEFPLVQAPMANSQDSALALAVSAAGGLGSLPAAGFAPERLRAELEVLAGSGLPYNVNAFCHRPPDEAAAGERAWRYRLVSLYREFGADLDALPDGPPRLPFDAATVDLLAEFRPPVVSFHFGLPAPALLEQVKGWGAVVMSTATTVAEAVWLAGHGADVVIAQGLEAGGHRGHFLSEDLTEQAGLFGLLPQVVAAVDVPVVAAGGVADAAGVRAALALGASGVQSGTVYLCSDEATTGPLHRAALQSDAARHTTLTNVFTGRPARGIVNRAVRELGPFSPDAPAFPLAARALGPLRAAAEALGSDDFTPLWCGQNAAGCRPGPAAEITAELARGVLG